MQLGQFLCQSCIEFVIFASFNAAWAIFLPELHRARHFLGFRCSLGNFSARAASSFGSSTAPKALVLKLNRLLAYKPPAAIVSHGISHTSASGTACPVERYSAATLRAPARRSSHLTRPSTSTSPRCPTAADSLCRGYATTRFRRARRGARSLGDTGASCSSTRPSKGFLSLISCAMPCSRRSRTPRTSQTFARPWRQTTGRASPSPTSNRSSGYELSRRILVRR